MLSSFIIPGIVYIVTFMPILDNILKLQGLVTRLRNPKNIEKTQDKSC